MNVNFEIPEPVSKSIDLSSFFRERKSTHFLDGYSYKALDTRILEVTHFFKCALGHLVIEYIVEILLFLY